MKELKEIQKEQIENVLKVVAEFYDCSVAELVSNDRRRTLIKARMISMYLMHKYLEIYICAIGNVFGRDHGVVIHYISTVKKQLEENKDYRLIVNYLWLRCIKMV